MFRLALLLVLNLISLPVFARTVIVAPSGFGSNTWQQAQLMHLQTQQQLQAQDQFRRQLLFQDHERQLQQLIDQQNRVEQLQHSATMHQYSDRLRSYSRPIMTRLDTAKKKSGK